MSDKFEAILKEAASLYVEREGEALIGESEAANTRGGAPGTGASRRRKIRRAAYIILPAAACIVMALLFILPGMQDTTSKSPPQSPAATDYARIEITGIAQRMPSGYTLAGTDYDNGKTIYSINDTLGSRIVLVAERTTEPLLTDGFSHKMVNSTDTYILSQPDYTVLFAQPNDVRYTITSEFGADELIEIAEKIL